MSLANDVPGRSGRSRAYRHMTIAGVLWGTIGPAAAIVDEHTALDPLQTSFWRMAIAALPLVILAIVAARAAPRLRPKWALLVLDAPGQVTSAGVLLSLAAAVTFALYSLGAGPASRQMDVRMLNGVAIAGGALILFPVVLATGGPGLAGSAVGWVALLHLGLIVSALAYGLYFSAARSLASTHLTILMLLEPLVATLIAAAAFGEHLTLGAISGGVLMLGAVGVLRPQDAESVADAMPAQASVSRSQRSQARRTSVRFRPSWARGR